MGGIKRKLLQKTLQYYIYFALIILIATAPVFYFTTQWLYLRKTGKTLRLSKKDFYKYSLPNLKKSDIDLWNKMDWSIKIKDYQPEIKHDSVFNMFVLDSIEHEYDPYRVLMTPIIIEKKPYTLMIRLNLIESDDIIKSTVNVFLSIIIFLLTGLYFITKHLSATLWKPFYQSLNQIEQFEIDKNELPQWLETNVEEFWRLNQSVNKLINRNITIYQSQQEFIENAAHELQTPLAVFQAKLDALLQTSHITQEQAEIIEYLDLSIQRLNRLNKNLLLLSRLDHNRVQERETLWLNEFLQKYIDFFYVQCMAKNIKFEYHCDQPFQIEANAILLDVLIGNLLQNAVLNTLPNNTISVSLQVNKMVISNESNSGSLDSSNLFKRFSKVLANAQGNGLGLAIVKKISDLHYWQINYKWINNYHVFEINFNHNTDRGKPKIQNFT